MSADLDTIRDEVKVRDRQDTTRVLAPLVKAPDAIEIDTSDLSVDAVVDRMAAIVAARRAPPARSALYSVRKLIAIALIRTLWRLTRIGILPVSPPLPVIPVSPLNRSPYPP